MASSDKPIPDPAQPENKHDLKVDKPHSGADSTHDKFSKDAQSTPPKGASKSDKQDQTPHDSSHKSGKDGTSQSQHDAHQSDTSTAAHAPVDDARLKLSQDATQTRITEAQTKAAKQKTDQQAPLSELRLAGTDKHPQWRANKQFVTKGGTTLTYDEQGRLCQINASNRKTVIGYDDSKNKGVKEPNSYVVLSVKNGKPDKMLDGGQKNVDRKKLLAVNNETGAFTVADLSGPKKIEKQYLIDNRVKTTVYDAKNGPISEVVQNNGPGAIKLESKSNYIYESKPGTPIDPEHPDRYKKVTTDGIGRLSSFEIYGAKDQKGQSNPVVLYQDKTTYVPHSDKHPNDIVQQHQILNNFGSASIRQEVTATLNTKTKDAVTTKVTHYQDSDEYVTQTNGKVTDFHMMNHMKSGKDARIDYHLQFKADKTTIDWNKTTCTAEGRPIADNLTKFFKEHGKGVLDNLGPQTVPQPGDAININDATPHTRDGVPPTNGTLVTLDSKTHVYHEDTVNNGQVMRSEGGKYVAIGKVDADGNVKLNDGTTYNIHNTEGAAFHGLGNDHKSLDIISDTDTKGFNGFFASPDRSQNYTVLGNHMYDQDGKFIGVYDGKGGAKFAEGKPPDSTLAARFADWQFEGSQDGHRRFFQANQENTESNGKPNFVNGVRHDVQNGMLINSENGEQYGYFRPPENDPSSGGLRLSYNAGFIERGDTGEREYLNDQRLANSVFNVQVVGQLSVFQFVTIPNPHEQGQCQIVNLQPGIAHEQGRINAAGTRESQLNYEDEQMGVFRYFNYDAANDMITGAASQRHADAADASNNLSKINQILTTGNIDLQLVYKMQGDQKETLNNLRSEQDRQAAQRKADGIPEPPKLTDISAPVINDQDPKAHSSNEVYGSGRVGQEAYTFNAGQVVNSKGKAVAHLDGYRMIFDDGSGRIVDLNQTRGAYLNIRFGEMHIPTLHTLCWEQGKHKLREIELYQVD